MGFLGDALDFVDGAVDSGTKVVAKGLQKGGHLAGEALDAAGLHGAGQTVSGWGDDIADDAGLKVKERNLDQSDDPAELLHGDAKKLNEVAGHLQKFHDAFDKAGQGLTRLDTDHWTGEAADNFRRDFDPQPKQWLAAADSFAKAGTALTAYAHTVGWAQDQAKDAVRIWKEAQKKTDAAAKSFMNDAMTYDLRLKAYNATPAEQRQGDPPADPGTFTPPADAVAQFKEAEAKLDAARTQRDSAARTALAAIKALVESAPAMPSRTEILKAEVMDTATSVPQLVIHFGGGIVKSAVDLNKLLRSVNPIDPYNATHPAEYATGLSGLLAGLSGSANNPVEAVKGLVGSGWGSDPAEAGGKLFGNLLLAPETGGGSVAATAAEREAVAVAENAAKNTAKEAAENTAKEATENAAKETAHKPVTPSTESAALPDVSTAKNTAQDAAGAPTGGAANIPSQKVPHPVQPSPDPLPASPQHPEFVTGPVKPAGTHPPGSPPLESGTAHGSDAPWAETPKHSDTEAHASGAADQTAAHDSQSADGTPAAAESAGDASTVKSGQDTAAPGGVHMPADDFNRLMPEDQMKVAWAETSQGARTFKNNFEAQEYGADYWNQYATNLPESQRNAVWDYTGDDPYTSYKATNPYLRSGGEATQDLLDRIAGIDGALAGRPIPEPIMVSRGTDLYHIPMRPDEMVGEVFREDSFTSASLGGSPFTNNQAMLHLKVPAGTPGLWVEKVSQYGSGEQEILLGRGIKWRCDRVVVPDQGPYQIYGEILP
ncbi:putative T7SS-secreted protein [Kitasatospora sp. NPDC127059]|uniref:putative T7SS-secreted protein n=1 Tax=unclassified Kitasatospora TaxID=2633591 RepID=UPI003656482A